MRYNYIHAEESKICVSREEFDSLQKELDYWQNTTINILNKYMYLIDNEGMPIKVYIGILTELLKWLINSRERGQPLPCE